MHTIHDAKGVYFYGNIQLIRNKCPKCGDYSIVKRGKTLCCDTPIIDEYTKAYRVSEPESRRNKPRKAEQEEILTKQDNSCFYCGSRFGSIKQRKGTRLALRIHWDHRIPYSLTQNNYAYNFVAACHVCNMIKSSQVFQTDMEAMIFLQIRRKEKGYNF